MALSLCDKDIVLLVPKYTSAADRRQKVSWSAMCLLIWERINAKAPLWNQKLKVRLRDGAQLCLNCRLLQNMIKEMTEEMSIDDIPVAYGGRLNDVYDAERERELWKLVEQSSWVLRHKCGQGTCFYVPTLVTSARVRCITTAFSSARSWPNLYVSKLTSEHFYCSTKRAFACKEYWIFMMLS